MKPGKARKDRPKGAKSFSRGSNKRVERSAVARPEKRDNRRDDKGDARKGFRKPVKTNDREIKRDDRRGDRPEKRFDRRGSMQDAVAGVNSFKNEALDTTQIVNKLANVDAAFAVSSADLAESIKRVGSTAQDAGVSFNELIALTTSLQQTTARGGSVIGNSLKSIFTRVQRTDTANKFEEMGIQVRDSNDELLGAIPILTNVAKSYDTLSKSQKQYISEMAGGVFQINQLKSLLSDLGKTNSTFSQAKQISEQSTDEAMQRNEKLNQTISAQANKATASVLQAASRVGEITFKPLFSSLLGKSNNMADMIVRLLDPQDSGNKVAKFFATGFLTGLGNILNGPGLAGAMLIL